MHDLVGKTIASRYTIEKKLGAGGMGQVYRAKQTPLERTVALKVIQPLKNVDDDSIKRFTREAKLASAMTHPNIVSVQDFGNDEGLFYLVMELVAGEELGDILRRETHLSAARARNIVRGIASALNTAHEQKIVHRDLKPENVVQNIDGQDFPRVLDFGIARSLEAGGTLTDDGAVIGTPLYLAPEVWQGERVTPAQDIYALGVMWFEMLEGRPPYGDRTSAPAPIMLAHLQSEIPYLTKEYPNEETALLQRMLSKDKSERPSAQDIVALLSKSAAPHEQVEGNLQPNEGPPDAHLATENLSGEYKPKENVRATVETPAALVAKAPKKKGLVVAAVGVSLVALAICAFALFLFVNRNDKPQPEPKPKVVVATPSAKNTKINTTPSWDTQRSFEKCAKNDAFACIKLAALYKKHNPSKERETLDKAFRIYQARCDKKEALACAQIAELIDARPDLLKSTRPQTYYAKACNLGYPQSCSKAVDLLYGTPLKMNRKNTPEVLSLLEKGCRLSDAQSCEWLADALHEGKGVTKNLSRARVLYERACVPGTLRQNKGCLRFGEALLKEGDAERAAGAFEWGCKGNKDAQVCNRAGQLYEKGQGVAKNLSTATTHYISACEIFSLYCANLGRLYKSKSLGVINDARARATLEKVCKKDRGPLVNPACSYVK